MAEDDWMPFANEPDAVKDQIVPFVTSTPSTVRGVVKLLNVTQSDKIIDVGCGDGRFVFEAISQVKCEGVGIDICEDLVKQCNLEAKEKGVETLAHFYVDNFLKEDFSFYGCNCISFYLVPKVLKGLKEKLFNYLEEDHSRRAVSCRFPFKGIIPSQIDEELKLYYYDYNSKKGEFTSSQYDDFVSPAF
ncbi:hypothetical protein EIN_187400 [Entamoeba invadens IP1]|uniref:hypothetical protein n=1 Tax=Entamoeba invadens IP1 TaxID=370355 RepID=UPI0002C3DE06|nr:hypothetical protein EIN_187400 [Entamoeba invadens IP1]ELP94273.1 hypothetical protein EIN_187400 [Entamoeba invadens IP1]|eukprot:XP_004261044.1 hypothetical protein EIN_187400 [Entamoeba invadens IP1]